MIRTLNNRINTIKKASPGYLSALTSGYALMGTNILVQFLLIPFYLKHLGEHQFGFLMVLLSIINFAAIGIGWMSGGLVRVIGEYWAKNDLDGFRNAFAVGKYVFTIYALLAVIVGFIVWFIVGNHGATEESLTTTLVLAGLYLVLNYEALPERQAFVGTNQQVKGNQIELVRILVFSGLCYLLLPQMQNMSAVLVALLSGIVLQRFVTGQYWRKRVGGTGWRRFTPEMRPIFKRLAGKQGAGYISYGALLLMLQADTIIVGFIGGAEAAGQFVLLWKIPEAIGLLLWKIPSTIEPRVIQLDTSGKKEVLQGLFLQGRRWFFLLVVVISLMYMVAGQWLAELWVGDNAPKERWMYIAAGVALFFNSFARWPISFAYALIKLKPLVRVATIELISKLFLTVLLFEYVGIAAPIIALIIIHAGYIAYAYQGIMASDVRKLVK